MRLRRRRLAGAVLAGLTASAGVVVTTPAASGATALETVWQYSPKIRIPPNKTISWTVGCPAGTEFTRPSALDGWVDYITNGSDEVGSNPRSTETFTNPGVLLQSGPLDEKQTDEIDRSGRYSGRKLVTATIRNRSRDSEVFRLKYDCRQRAGWALGNTGQTWPDVEFDYAHNARGGKKLVVDPFDKEADKVDGDPQSVAGLGGGWGCNASGSSDDFRVNQSKAITYAHSDTTTTGFALSSRLDFGKFGIGADISYQVSHTYGVSITDASSRQRDISQPIAYGSRTYVKWIPKVYHLTGTIELWYEDGVSVYSDGLDQKTDNDWHGGRVPFDATAGALEPGSSAGAETWIESDLVPISRRMTAAEEIRQCDEDGTKDEPILEEPEAGGEYIINLRAGAAGYRTSELAALDVHGGRTTPGAAILAWPENHQTNQTWTLVHAGARTSPAGGTVQLYRIRSKNNAQMCLAYGTGADLPFTQDHCDGGASATTFFFESSGGGQQWYYLRPWQSWHPGLGFQAAVLGKPGTYSTCDAHTGAVPGSSVGRAWANEVGAGCAEFGLRRGPDLRRANG